MVHDCEEGGYIKCVQGENLEGVIWTGNAAKESLENQKKKTQTEGIISNFPHGSKYYVEKFGVAGGM
jgi:hypothetical protein